MNKKVILKGFSILLIILLLTPNHGIFAEIILQDNNNYKAGHGEIENQNGSLEKDRAIINKEVSFGNRPGEYFIDLTVAGKYTTTDLVILYDLSNSMEDYYVPGTNRKRTDVAGEATRAFIEDLLNGDGYYRVAYVPFGTAIMDGETKIKGQDSDKVDPTNNEIHKVIDNKVKLSVENYTNDAAEIVNHIPLSISHHPHYHMERLLPNKH